MKKPSASLRSQRLLRKVQVAFLVASTFIWAGAAMSAPLFAHVHTFKGSPNQADGTGRSVALTETHALVASPDNKGIGPNLIARIYDFQDAAPVAEILSPAFPRRNGSLGSKAAMAGHRALVCGEGYDQNPPDQNLAYIHDIATGEKLLRLKDPSGLVGSKFGASCALTERNALVGAPGYGAAKKNGGAAYLFDTQTGALLHEFLPSTPQRQGEFGFRFALSDRYAAIVQRQRTAELGGPGAVYVFDLESGLLARTFDKHEDDRGYVGAVALQGDQILIGHTYGRVNGRRTGRVDIFDIKTRKHIRRLLPPGAAPNRSFGGSAVWSDDLILLGATDIGNSGQAFEGVAMIYDANTGEHLQTLTRPTKDGAGVFPSRIAMSGNRILIGAINDSMLRGGSAYLYERQAR